MDDLRRRFASLDQVRAPDLWTDIEQRAVAFESVQRVTRAPDSVSVRSRGASGRTLIVLVAPAALLVALVAGAVAVGTGLVKRPTVVPVEAWPSATALPSRSVEPQVGVVAYTVRQGDCAKTPPAPCVLRIWIVNADGSGARELLAQVPGTQEILGWSPDGSRLLYREPRGDGSGPVFATDADGSEPELICAAEDGSCAFEGGGAAGASPFSPDGGRIAYVISEGGGTERSTVAIMDLSTRQVTKFNSTRTPDVRQCDSAASDGLRFRNSRPSWSPDGTLLVFDRDGTGKTLHAGTCRAGTVFVVNADGSELLQLTSAEMVAFDPSWSPDGTRIAFWGDERKPSTRLWATDLYTIRPDGTDMRRLTTDGGAGWGEWTNAGQIVFRHSLGGGVFDEVLLINTDGTGDAQIDDDNLADLTAAGCTICPYAPSAAGVMDLESGHGDAYWQPVP